MKKGWLILCAALLLLPFTAAADGEEYGYEEDFPGVVVDGTLILPEGITALGCYVGDWVYNPETDEWDIVEHPEEEAWFQDSYSFDFWFTDPAFSSVQWPSTMKCLGGEAFLGYHFGVFVLPATLEKICDYAVSCDMDVLRIETTLPWEQIGELRWDGNGMDNVIGAYEAPEDHPLYKTVDGVLFTKDGKTLLSYPNGRTAIHYDVPKGVEHIADQAFANEYLQTVSLPIGLKTVGDYGFSGCTRLQSIALPLTVTEIGKEIFADCVSLELVSLPEGLQADKQLNDWWTVYYRDEDRYRGDNGDTFPSPASQAEYAYSSDWESLYVPGRVTGPEDTVTAYLPEEEGEALFRLAQGQVFRLIGCENGLVGLQDPFTWETVSRVKLENAECLPGETLFAWADIKPRAAMSLWWDHLPLPREDRPAQETRIPREMAAECEGEAYGPFVIFRHWESDMVFACRIQDAELTREPDGTDSVYGIVYSQDVFADVPLRSGPGGEITEYLIGGTQIRVLDQDENGCFVTTGIVNGWVNGENIRIIPEKQEGN